MKLKNHDREYKVLQCVWEKGGRTDGDMFHQSDEGHRWKDISIITDVISLPYVLLVKTIFQPRLTVLL